MMDNNDNGRTVDLGKRTGIVGQAPVKEPGQTTLKKMITILLVVAIIVLALLWMLKGAREETPPPAATVEAAKIVDAPVVKAEVASEPQEAAVAAEEPEEEVDHRGDGFDKICSDLADDFVNAKAPTREQQERTLIIYNINRCSNMFIRNADAEKHGLTAEQLEAVKADREVGSLHIEDN